MGATDEPGGPSSAAPPPSVPPTTWSPAVVPPAPWGVPTTGPRAPRKTDGFAVAGFVVAVFGLVPLAVVFSLVGWFRIRRSHGATSGRGFAVAAWLISVVWVGVAALAVTYGDALWEENVDAYPTGPEHEVALVIDRFEAAGPEETCTELLTPELRDLLDTTTGGCESAAAYDRLVVPDIDITSISVRGDVATVEVVETGQEYTVTLRYDGTSWRIDDLG